MMSFPEAAQTNKANELEKVKLECASMIETLKNLKEEELSLRYQNKILAREIINCGYSGEVVEPVAQPQKRRKKASSPIPKSNSK